MFKKCKYFLVVDSVESAIKFYAEKLLFLVVDVGMMPGANTYVNYAELRRGKCQIIVRTPVVTELAEFSMVRRLNNRANGIYLEIKQEISIFYNTCRKKKLNIVSEINRHPSGYVYFQMLDPFGSRIYFYQPDEHAIKIKKSFDGPDFLGMKMNQNLWDALKNDIIPQDIIDYLKQLGMSRRVAKRFIKNWFKLKLKDDDDDGEDDE